MSKKIGRVGVHQEVEVISAKDINGRFMVRCADCETYSHSFSEKEAIENLEGCSCNPNCRNCNNLRDSASTRPAIPSRGDCNTILHVCPNDGNKWWQSNNYFHHWQRVTDPEEWEILKKQYEI